MIRTLLPPLLAALVLAGPAALAPHALRAQQQPGTLAAPRAPSPALRTAAQLDLEGRFQEARPIFQAAVDSAADPAAKASARRALAMSYAFAGDCQGTLRYEQQVIDYWKTREQV
ncbi:MAG TPA: hypothetical protein VMK66_01265, partial [Myxococcales bacterium]|nr:hypothetical protein [Myxococcales bacterium]